jgi:hypothetical protein
MFHPELQVAIKGIKELVAQGKVFSFELQYRSLLIYTLSQNHGSKRASSLHL